LAARAVENKPERSSPGSSHCRSCGAALELTVVDLGKSPLCESILSADKLEAVEPFYPLHVRVCERCWLAQLPAFVSPEEIFDEYAYFSAYSDSWVEHARAYVEMITDRLGLTPESLVIELASNDGYLLQHFVPLGIPVLGIDPAANVAGAAEERSVPTLVEYFGVELAQRLADEGRRADLVIGNNVLAQVPDLDDFVRGVELVLAPGGTATFEFPHLARLIEGVQYDTIYHEHFSYFSLFSIIELFGSRGLSIVDVTELPSHGGSLRVYVARTSEDPRVAPAVRELLEREEAEGFHEAARYTRFSADVEGSKRALLSLLIGWRAEGKQIVGYGAPGKGNTLLNYCGIRGDLIEYLVDRNPYKQGMFTPGTQLPILPLERIEETRPDVIVILPWNLAREISSQLAYTAAWGAKLVVPIPTARVLETLELAGS
jgi:SAM-dependent methyltransferase